MTQDGLGVLLLERAGRLAPPPTVLQDEGSEDAERFAHGGESRKARSGSTAPAPLARRSDEGRRLDHTRSLTRTRPSVRGFVVACVTLSNADFGTTSTNAPSSRTPYGGLHGYARRILAVPDPYHRGRCDLPRPPPEKPESRLNAGLSLRADDRVRTGDPQLGKLMLYQLSYVRAQVILLGDAGIFAARHTSWTKRRAARPYRR